MIESRSFDIIQITVDAALPESNAMANNFRLLVLSHRLGHQGVPAFYLDGTPPYSSFPAAGAVVVAFDLFRSFDRFRLSDELFEAHRWTWDATADLPISFFDHLQRALTVRAFYEFRKYDPLYFTTFLLVAGTDMISEPFIYQPVPVRRSGTICVRTVIQGGLSVLVGARLGVQVGSYVLVPPFEHPFSVVALLRGKLTLLYVDRSVRTILPDRVFAHLTNPNLAMPSYFKCDGPMRQPLQKELAALKATDFFDYEPAELARYFAARFASDSEGQDDMLSSLFEYEEPTIIHMIGEQIESPDERRAVEKAIGNEPYFPSKRCKLQLIIANFLSFFRFDFGFSEVSPPSNGQGLATYSFCEYQRLGIPRILVNYHGALRDVPADTVCERWEEERFLPISGPKNCHFVVFSHSVIHRQAVECFFSEFSHIYNLLGFGRIAPVPEIECFYFELPDHLATKIDEFFKGYPLSEFRECPVLSFIVAPPIFDPAFHPHTIVTYVRPAIVTSASEDEMKSLALVVYSRIRVFAPSPFGMIDVAGFETATLFFGYRYQPPYLLRRQHPFFTMHVAWDPVGELTTWMDDMGSVLHVLPRTSLDVVARLLNDFQAFLTGPDVRITFTVLGEGISADLFGAIERKFGQLLKITSVFAVAPAPAVQGLFKDVFDDDVVISAPMEQASDGAFRLPLATCFVASQRQPAYACSLYFSAQRGEPEGLLMEYVKNMSHLSWLSVKPGSEKRTISYPPHVCALLRKNHSETLVVNRFEFLPSTECV
jgi:hypothetical protein